MSNINLPNNWSSWAIIGAIIFLALLATGHPATAFTGLFFVLLIFILVLLADSGFSSGALWIVFVGLVALLLILGLGYVRDEWKPQQTPEASAQSLSVLLKYLME